MLCPSCAALLARAEQQSHPRTVQAPDARTGHPGAKNCHMHEADFQAQVLRLLRTHGYLTYHTRDSRGSDKGMPDILATNGKRVLFIELKSAKGKLTPEQAQWLSLLQHAGQEAYCWRPADWANIEDTVTPKERVC